MCRLTEHIRHDKYSQRERRYFDKMINIDKYSTNGSVTDLGLGLVVDSVRCRDAFQSSVFYDGASRVYEAFSYNFIVRVC